MSSKQHLLVLLWFEASALNIAVNNTINMRQLSILPLGTFSKT